MHLAGQQVDVIARRDLDGGPRVVIAVECKDHKARIGNQLVQDFAATVTAMRAANAVTSGVMVSSSGFTSHAHAVVRDVPYLSLFSWDDLTAELFTVSHRLRELHGEYEHSPMFRHYLSLDVQVLSWPGLSPSARPPPLLDDVISSWMANGSTSVPGASLFVLADFGSGKTTLLRHLEYLVTDRYLNGIDRRIPLFVPLRLFTDGTDIMTLLRASFRASYYRDVSEELLWQRTQAGSLCVLLDGFDEMADRSDAGSRAELFHLLLPLLQSPSPTALTSRPSYFVEPGELHALVALLRRHEARFQAPALIGDGGTSMTADHVRRHLVHRHREATVTPGAHQALDSRRLRVVRLLPLNRERIKAFVEKHADALLTARTTPEAIMAFVDRTYDLSDLATRPLLLALIIDTVLADGVDIHDPGLQFGPSGLYEMYTHAKLDLDLAKGAVRQGGLTLEIRRALAEALAMEMYTAGTIETNFRTMVARFLTDPGELGGSLRDSGLTADQIATDFATCSFVTLDLEGRCRFVHKSFRGFFVARVVKEQLRAPHPVLRAWVEREVLYFLGGFGPTQPRVSDAIWGGYVGAPSGSALRRNLLVAFLYTRPEHDGRRISDGEVADADYRRLQFLQSRMDRVTWRDCSLRELTLRDAYWAGVRFVDSHVGQLHSAGGRHRLEFERAAVEGLRIEDTNLELTLDATTLDTCDARSAILKISLHAARVGRLEVAESLVTVDDAGGTSSGLRELSTSQARVWLGKRSPAGVRAERSVLSFAGAPDRVLDWSLEQCVVVLAADEAQPPGVVDLRAGIRAMNEALGATSVVLSAGAVAVNILWEATCGVFGEMSPGTQALDPGSTPRGWGVLRVGSPETWDEPWPSDAVGACRGRVLLAGQDWYDRALMPNGALSAVRALQHFAARVPDIPWTVSSTSELEQLLAAVDAQYRAIDRERWHSLDKRA